MNSSDSELKDKRIFDFLHPEDREGVDWISKKLERSGDALPVRRVFRLRSSRSKDRFCQFSIPAKPPWSGAIEIYLEDVTQSHYLEQQNLHLEEMVKTFSDCINGKMLLLNRDLIISEARGRISGQSSHADNARFKGMAFRKATGLADVKLNGKTLWQQLSSCVETGRPINRRSVTYWGRVDKDADLLRPGDYRITVNPSQGANKKITSSLVMVIEAMSSFGAGREVTEFTGDPGRLESILGSSASAFVLKDILGQVYDPLTRLSAQMDLLFYKTEMVHEKTRRKNGHSSTLSGQFVADRTRVQDLTEELCNRLGIALQSISLMQGADTGGQTDTNKCLSRAITLVRSSRNSDDAGVSTSFDPDLPAVKPDDHDLVMMFMIHLLMSKSSLVHVTDQTIHCETEQKKNHVAVKITHNGYIQRQDDLKAMFGGKPLESYFAASGSIQSTETLLRYANFLSDKHRIKMRLTNIPGHFELRFNIPTIKGAKRRSSQDPDRQAG